MPAMGDRGSVGPAGQIRELNLPTGTGITGAMTLFLPDPDREPFGSIFRPIYTDRAPAGGQNQFRVAIGFPLEATGRLPLLQYSAFSALG